MSEIRIPTLAEIEEIKKKIRAHPAVIDVEVSVQLVVTTSFIEPSARKKIFELEGVVLDDLPSGLEVDFRTRRGG